MVPGGGRHQSGEINGFDKGGTRTSGTENQDVANDGVPPDDGLGFWRGLRIAIPLSIIAWLLIAGAVVWAVRSSPVGQDTPFDPRHAEDGQIEVWDCPGGSTWAHVWDLARSQQAGIQIEVAGAVRSACTQALLFENVSWNDRHTVFCFHAIRRDGQISREATRRFWRQFPDSLQALMPDPETVGLAYTCIPGEIVRNALERTT